MKTFLSLCVLFLCFVAVEAQVPPVTTVPPPTLQKAIVEEIAGTPSVGASATRPTVIRIRGNWAYPVPRGVPDPWKVERVRYRVTKKVYATVQDAMDGKGEGRETSTGWYNVPPLTGEGASGIINTTSAATLTPGKINRLTVDMTLSGSYRSKSFNWTQKAEGLFFGEGVK